MTSLKNIRKSSSGAVDFRLITLGTVMILGLFGAVFAGRSIASGSYTPLLAIAGLAAAISIPLMMGKNIWLLIPITSLATGKINALPIPFSVAEMGILAAFGSYMVFSVMKKVDRPAPLTFLDKLLIWNLVYVLITYVRNPAGFAFFQTSIVGGRPYFVVILAILAFWVLQRVTINAKTAFWFPFIASSGGVLTSVLGILTARFPFLVPIIFPIYSGVSIDNYMAEESIKGTGAAAFGEQRETSFLSFSSTMVPLLVSYKAPIRLALFLNPFLSILFYAAFIGMLLSGFRSGLLNILSFVVLASYFREGMQGVLRIGIVLIFGLLLLAVGNVSGVPIPNSIQRAVSFLPGEWNEEAVLAAEESTDWRLEMWETALTSDRYIKNKILGDGFGFDVHVYNELVGKTILGGSGIGVDEQKEFFMITGAYHSGPVSAIRYVGVLGLMLFTILLIAMAIEAWRLIKQTKRSPFFAAALFVGIAIIYKPFSYWLIFGAFETDLPFAIISLAYLNIISRSFRLWKNEQDLKNIEVKEEQLEISEQPVPAAT